MFIPIERMSCVFSSIKLISDLHHFKIINVKTKLLDKECPFYSGNCLRKMANKFHKTEFILLEQVCADY